MEAQEGEEICLSRKGSGNEDRSAAPWWPAQPLAHCAVLAHQHTGGISGGGHSGRGMEVLRRAGRDDPEPGGVLPLLQPAELPEGRPPGLSRQSMV